LAIALTTSAIAAGRLGGCSFWLRPSKPGCWLSDRLIHLAQFSFADMSGYINRNTGSPIQCAAIMRPKRKQLLAYYILLTVLQLFGNKIIKF